MINLHNAQEVYQEVLKVVKEKMEIYSKFYNEKQNFMENRLKFINQTEKQIIL